MAIINRNSFITEVDIYIEGIVKGTDRLYKVVQLSKQCCGQILQDSFEIYKTFPRCIIIKFEWIVDVQSQSYLTILRKTILKLTYSLKSTILNVDFTLKLRIYRSLKNNTIQYDVICYNSYDGNILTCNLNQIKNEDDNCSTFNRLSLNFRAKFHLGVSSLLAWIVGPLRTGRL